MLDEIRAAVTSYQTRWQQLITERKETSFFENLKPTAACFKVADLDELDNKLHALREYADHIHWGWINERWLVTVHLRSPLIPGVEVVKVYQKRPGSSDPTGLDHMDFYASTIDENILADEPDLIWTRENNGPLSSWISIWFAETEAKLRTDTTVEVCSKELQAVHNQIVRE
jgi:hypothetical protein